MKRTQALLIAVAFVPLGAAGVVAVHFGRGALQAQRYRTHFAELEERGVLPPAAELAPASTPDAKRVRDELTRVRTSLGDAFPGRSDFDALALHEPDWSVRQLAWAREWVVERSEFYDAVDDLTSNRIARRAAQKGERVISQAPKLRELRASAQALVVRARFQAARGEHERAARNFAQGMLLVKLSGDGTMFSSMMGMAVRNFLWNEAASFVEAGLIEPRAMLAALGPELQASFDAAEVDRVLRFELAGLRDVEPVEPSLAEGALSFLQYPREAERMVAGLEARERCLGLVALRGEAFETERRAILEGLSGQDPLLVSQAVGFVTTARQEHSFELLFRVALAARASRAADGEWPTSLELLAPFLDGQVPDDPWTGEPFPYVRRDDGWVLGPAGGALGDDFEAQLRQHQVYRLR